MAATAVGVDDLFLFLDEWFAAFGDKEGPALFGTGPETDPSSSTPVQQPTNRLSADGRHAPRAIRTLSARRRDVPRVHAAADLGVLP